MTSFIFLEKEHFYWCSFSKNEINCKRLFYRTIGVHYIIVKNPLSYLNEWRTAEIIGIDHLEFVSHFYLSEKNVFSS